MTNAGVTAVVVGSGPNGLAAALTLAEAGVSVTIIEGADVVGGGVRSAELTLPGLLHDECSGFHPFATSSPFALAAGLDHDVTWRWAPHQLAHPLDGGRGAVLDRSVDVTAEGLGTDGASWRRMFGPLTERFDTISEEFLQPVIHVPRHPIHLARFGAYAALPASVLARRWSGEEAKGLFGGVAAHGFTRLDLPFSSAIGVALTTSAHRYGWPVAEGGSQAIAAALVARLTSLGVRIETGRTVTSASELGEPDLLMLDTAPGAAAGILGGRQSARARRAYRRYRHGPAAFKVDFAIEGGVPWAFEPARSAGTVHLGGTFDEIAASEAAVARGVMPERPFVLVGQQYVADPTRSASPSDGLNPLYTYAHVPAGFRGDATEAIIGQLERFAPGFRDIVRATYVRSATAMAQHNPNYVGGDIATGAADLRQIVFRPRAGLDPYFTGAPGAYLCSAATPPGAGAHGMSGMLAAQSALRSLP
ncbi:phytoene desaturase family protein [Nocardioides sp. Kera G14]|uniref:phytoene desaturase family protein n=1 Tax=Nocardioides sp. Kera G14 TaxID=2884264 RepID=UPI001D10276D|nr:NAD(P)/FAD-dependent oxidoreductase [Nocardioides sp. Kera G14]UDY23327.1 NAD(P)/FAD-dependent oxidoreductase [Nocardioides sp. Kera G14]